MQFKEEVGPASINFSGAILLLSAERAQSLKEATQRETAVDTEETDDHTTEQENEARERKETSSSQVDTLIEHVAFRASGIPSSRIADLNRGVFLPLSEKVGEFTFTIEVDVRSVDGIPERVVEHKVKETLRQLGANITEDNAGL